MSKAERAALPPAPDDSQPEGCPDNPMWGGSITIRFSYPGVGEDGGSSTEWATAGLTNSTDDRALVQEGNEETARRRCDRAPAGSVKTVLPSGFTVCRIKPNDNRPVDRWSTVYVADPHIYTAPGDRPFIIECLSGELTSEPYGCNVNYRVQWKLTVFYKVNFRRTSIEEVIGLDAALREFVKQAETADYLWPTPALPAVQE